MVQVWVHSKYLSNQHISLIPDEFSTEGQNRYSYALKGTNTTYVFVIKELNQWIDANEGMEELLDTLIPKSEIKVVT